MECKGKITQILGVDKNHINVLLSLTDANTEGLQELTGVDLTVNLKKFHPKRSLDSNAYAWTLISRLAEVYKTSKEEMYEFKLRQYGVPYENEEGGHVVVAMKNSVPLKKLPGHWLFIGEKNGASNYMMIKGSSEYDSAEMAHFIDMIVQDAKDVGIETLTPKELQQMKEDWEKRYGKKDSDKHTD